MNLAGFMKKTLYCHEGPLLARLIVYVMQVCVS